MHSPDQFYRDELPVEWCQGDIVAHVPHLSFTGALRVLRLRQGGRTGWIADIYTYDPGLSDADQVLRPQQPFRLRTSAGDLLVAECQLNLGIILSHDCEIDKERKYILVAPVRPFLLVPDEHKETIHSNTQYRTLYLPEKGEDMPAGYADFRRISPVRMELLSLERRIASLTPDAVLLLQSQLVLFFTHPEEARVE
jgi:hypothetical protein